MTFFDYKNFSKFEEHIHSCDDCTNRIHQFEFSKEQYYSYFNEFKITDDIRQSLERELNSLITEEKEESESVVKTKLDLSLKNFIIYILFGISRRTQLMVIGLFILAIAIY